MESKRGSMYDLGHKDEDGECLGGTHENRTLCFKVLDADVDANAIAGELCKLPQ